mmetsp:Transcript_14075/g.30569  ORF Transcript_14075/g.30569 Transcript_14075/m.30569 type:complete len:167 (-) Transcript_14075:585-1085(-)
MAPVMAHGMSRHERNHPAAQPRRYTKMLPASIFVILFANTSTLFADAWTSSIRLFTSSPPLYFWPIPSSQSSSWHLQGANLNATLSETGNNVNGARRVVVQKISLDDTDELKRMSRFCINSFYDQGEDGGGSLLSRKWKDIKLGAMQKAQLLVSLCTIPIYFNMVS